MQQSIYVPNELAEKAAARYHRLIKEGYTFSELCQVALAVLADSSDAKVRAAVSRRKVGSRSRPALPGLMRRRAAGEPLEVES